MRLRAIGGFLKGRILTVCVFMILVFSLPLLEAASLSLVYALLSPDQVTGGLEWIGSRTGLAFPSDTMQLRLLIFAAAVVCVLLMAAGRVVRIRLLADIKYRIYEDSLSQLADSYLGISVRQSLHLNRDLVANVAIRQGGTIADYVVCVLGLVSSSLAAIILATSSMLYASTLTLIAGAVAVLSVVINRGNFTLLRSVGEDKVEAHQLLIREVRRLLSGFERIKLDMLESAAARRMREVIQKNKAWRVSKLLTRENVAILSGSFNALATATIVLIGVAAFGIEAGVFVILLLLFSRLRGYVVQVQSEYVQLRELGPAVRRSLTMLDTLRSQREEGTSEPYSKPRRVEFQDVTLGYGGEPVIEEATLSLESGDRILLQGASGEGKTTLLKALCGLLPPASGTAAVVGEDGREELVFRRMRRSCFYCSQDLYLFDGTVREVLNYGGAAADTEIDAALDKAGLCELIAGLPDGIDSDIGDDGENLSLGQRGRLLLARLFFREPWLVLLDEATANVDLELEEKLFRNVCSHLPQGAIVVVVAHRPPQGIPFNRTIQVNGGMVSEYGESR